MTPLAGTGWLIAEDAIDRFLIEKIEDWSGSPFVLYTGALFPESRPRLRQSHGPKGSLETCSCSSRSPLTA